MCLLRQCCYFNYELLNLCSSICKTCNQGITIYLNDDIHSSINNALTKKQVLNDFKKSYA